MTNKTGNNISNDTFNDLLQSSNDYLLKDRTYLYHGIRFDAINKLESIFQTGLLLPSNKIKRTFISYDGTVKHLYIYNDDENCNLGKYVSVMPYENNLEFELFVRENLFFVFKGSIGAIKTKHVSYNEYCELRRKKLIDTNYYSYAVSEYFVEDGISLNDAVYIGIDSNHFNGDYDQTVADVIHLIDIYKIDKPFIDESTNSEIYRLSSNNKRL